MRARGTMTVCGTASKLKGSRAARASLYLPSRTNRYAMTMVAMRPVSLSTLKESVTLASQLRTDSTDQTLGLSRSRRSSAGSSDSCSIDCVSASADNPLDAPFFLAFLAFLAFSSASSSASCMSTDATACSTLPCHRHACSTHPTRISNCQCRGRRVERDEGAGNAAVRASLTAAASATSALGNVLLPDAVAMASACRNVRSRYKFKKTKSAFTSGAIAAGGGQDDAR
mmetsp:Transcript_14791/g.46393  ORF Transcript_14791/g.46393 Transcript_14791/m.46393 type:complete len:228 (-) Transcript_14791:138-821(-)